MNTPIADFVRGYEKKNMLRLHMPGHKGKSFLGCEAYDITEVKGADSLYEAEGIIAESEANAGKLFGTGRTVYSTEGSSQCIRAMLYLALTNQKRVGKPVVVAARNVHKAFVYAAALLDIEVKWIYPEGDMHSLCSCQISPRKLEETLEQLEEPPVAVYVTSPDYLGGQLDIKELAEVCHRNQTILLVDNAHGAYLHFLEEKKHPIDLGADICCDSAHKTLPVLTGGAYLQIGQNAHGELEKHAKSAMALFGSTSPSYLILSSLDLCNQYLSENYEEKLQKTVVDLKRLRKELRNKGWRVENTEPLKLTVKVPDGMKGRELAEQLRKKQIECEYADPEYVVCMFTPEIEESVYQRILEAFGENLYTYVDKIPLNAAKCEQVMSIREAIFTEHEEVQVSEAVGRICGTPTVSCPPAIPIVVSGERINEEAIQLFEHYGITTIDVIKGKGEEI
ncbi:MAG: aminotransferase class V-fold PLP-dependent enzyme [Tyzzerella sp.]|nr:aminotransferase class V-fold PLP-dependent enzyme [Tyzzerella sp.]